MQRRAAAVYVAMFLVITVGSYGATLVATPPDVSIDPDHELSQGDSVTINGTTFNVTELNASAAVATLEAPGDNETRSVEVTEGKNVTLGGTTFVGHFEGNTLQLSRDLEAYQAEVDDVEAHEDLMHDLQVVATLSGITGFVLLAVAYMPVRGD